MHLKSFCKYKALVLSMLIFLVHSNGLAQLTYTKGQPVYPAFEGWRENPDGTFNFMFGYFNDNWDEQPFISVGENNYFTPGEADRGQPTKFFPRRNRWVFEVTVPGDWGDRELVWTLNVNGSETKAYATLNPSYVVSNIFIASETGSLSIGTSNPEIRANTPPELSVQGDAARSVRVGEPLTIVSNVTDDGVPRSRITSTIPTDMLQRRLFSPPFRPTVNKINALFVSWNVYRGQGKVTFDPPQTKVWEDTRAGGNSPWGVHWRPPEIPEDGEIEVTATFSEPGTYTLWGRADDGGLYHDAYITVDVNP